VLRVVELLSDPNQVTFFPKSVLRGRVQDLDGNPVTTDVAHVHVDALRMTTAGVNEVEKTFSVTGAHEIREVCVAEILGALRQQQRRQ
jgi:hypothetical protein